MSKITNDGLTRSGTGCFINSCTHTATVGVKRLKKLGRKSHQESKSWYSWLVGDSYRHWEWSGCWWVSLARDSDDWRCMSSTRLTRDEAPWTAEVPAWHGNSRHKRRSHTFHTSSERWRVSHHTRHTSHGHLGLPASRPLLTLRHTRHSVVTNRTTVM